VELPVVDLPTCRWRGGELQEGWFPCASNKLVVGPRGVTADLCQQCPYANHEPFERAAPAPERPILRAGCRHLGRRVRENGKTKTRRCLG
jgi:hypothetical protein